MRAKMLTKRAFSLIFSLMVILLVSCVSLSAFAAEAECDHPNLKADKWTVISQPTCSKSGVKEQFCGDCNENVTFLIDLNPDAHNIGAWEMLTPNSCTQTGLKVRKCVDCKKILEREVIPAHNYTVLYGNEATCVREGYQFKMCTTCYDMITVTLPVDEDAHNYGEWHITNEATCVNNSGERTRKCGNTDVNGVYCGAEEIENFVNPENHVSITWREDEKVLPTCYKDGYTPGTCNDCKNQVRDILPKHSNAMYQVLYVIPATCHSEGIERRLCKGVDPENPCGFEYDAVIEIDENAHAYDDWRISKEANCTPGERVRYCKYHPSATQKQTIPATGEHVYGDWVVTQEPDCTTTGIKEKTCTVEGCNAKITETLPVHHVYGTWTTTVEMSCKDGNIKTGSKTAVCNYCNYKKSFTVPAIHSFGQWYVKEKADCKNGNPGTMERKCASCGKSEIKTYEAEHDYTPWIVTTAPACADEAAGKTGRTGTYTRWCKTCKAEETKRIPVTHEYENWEIIEYPTCSESGSKTGTCKFCGKVCKEAIDYLGHNYTEWEITVEPDCSKEDNKEGSKKRTCKVCKDIQEESIPAQHDYEWLLDGENICESEKLVYNKICVKCKTTSTAEDPIVLVKGYHPNLRTNVIKESCATSGYKVDYCPDCGYNKVYDIVPATGHELSEKWYDMVKPSCTSKGSRYKTCANCDYIEFVAIDSTKHLLMTIKPGYEPTCTEPGLSAESYCAECKQTFPAVTLPAKGHVYENGACKVCRVYENSNECLCSCHSTDAFDAMIFNIIRKLYQIFGINQVCACGELHYDEVGFIGKLFGRG